MALKNCLLLFLWLAFGLPATAQLCQGSLGDPIVNITFGAGSNPGPPLTAAATNYTYTNTECPLDGSYTVRNSITPCFSNTWHALARDHTGDPNGYFMVVNASYQPSAFFVDTVNVVCSNTTYLFSAWMLNMISVVGCTPAIEPNLTFSIEKLDGTLLQTYNTGNIPSQSTVNWKQYGFFFTAPPNVNSIVVRITNNATGGCGNDIALDDITFRPCGPQLTAAAGVGGATIRDICEGDAAQVLLTGNIQTGYTDPYFQWQQSADNGSTWTDIAGANTPTWTNNFSATTPVGTYQYRVTVSKAENKIVSACRVVSNVVTVRIHPLPKTTVANNGPVCPGANVVLTASGGTKYTWTSTNGFAATGATATAKVFAPGTYYVTVSDNLGCSKKDSTVVALHPKPLAAVAKNNIDLCEGDAASLSSSGGTSYLWQPAVALSSITIANPTASPKDSTRYMVIVTNNFNCPDTAFVQVNVLRKPVANAGPDKRVLLGQKVQLTGAASGTNISYVWSPDLFISALDSLQPYVNPPNDITYRLEVTSNSNCGTAIDSVKVYVLKDLFVPNAFSPNSDGLNDTWQILGIDSYAHYEVFVYNRYGQVVYGGKNMKRPWDGTFKGKLQPAGLYPYLIEIKDINLRLSGWVMIIR